MTRVIIKKKLKELSVKIIKNEPIMAGIADDPEWLEENLYRFQKYNPGLFGDQLTALLSDVLPENKETGLVAEFDLIMIRVMGNLSYCNMNTQINRIPELRNLETYEYSIADGAEMPSRRTLRIKLVLKGLPGDLCMNAAYSKLDNILFVQVQPKEYQRKATADEIKKTFQELSEVPAKVENLFKSAGLTKEGDV